MIERLADIGARRLALLETAIILLLVIAGSMYVVLPAWKDYRKAASEHAALAVTVRQDRRAIPDVDRIRRELAGFESRLAAAGQSASTTAMMEELRAAADASGVRLGGLVPVQSAPLGRVEPVGIDVEARGSYASLAAFIGELEERSPALAVTSLRMSVQAEGAELLLKLRITGYRFLKGQERSG